MSTKCLTIRKMSCLEYSGTWTYEKPIIRKIQNTKQSSKKFPSNLTSKHSRYETKIISARLEIWSVIIRNKIYYYFLIVFFNIYVNDYVDISGRIPSGGYKIYPLYDWFLGPKRLTLYTGYILYHNKKKIQDTKSPPQRINFLPRGITISCW